MNTDETQMGEATKDYSLEPVTLELLKAARRAKKLAREKVASDSEDAEWFQLVHGIGAVRGKPQPEANNEWIQVTYDVSQWCRACNGGAIQKAPYRFTGELKLGKLGLFQPYYGFPDLFAERGVWENLLAPLGVKSMPILHAKSQVPLKTAVQLDLASIAWDGQFDEDAHDKWTCDQCHRVIFAHPRFSPPCFDRYPNQPIFSTSQRFGDHIYSYPLLYVNREAAAQFASAKLKYVSLRPVV